MAARMPRGAHRFNPGPVDSTIMASGSCEPEGERWSRRICPSRRCHGGEQQDLSWRRRTCFCTDETPEVERSALSAVCSRYFSVGGAIGDFSKFPSMLHPATRPVITFGCAMMRLVMSGLIAVSAAIPTVASMCQKLFMGERVPHFQSTLNVFSAFFFDSLTT